MSTLDLPAVGYAALAALLFAAANNLQRGAASVVPMEVGGPIRLVLRLLRAPRWLLGSVLALGALGLHAVALARGGVILVQAILAAGLIVALGIEAAQERRWMHRWEVIGAILLIGGVTALLGWGRPGGGRPVDVTVQAVTAAVLLAVGGIGLFGSRLHHWTRTSAILMGAAAGGCFAVDAVFLKGVANNADDLDALPALISLAGFAVASLIGNLVVQRAYQRAPLRLVLPAVTAADPLAAFLVGRWVLDERLQGGAGSSLAVGLGLVGMAVGITLTTTGSITAHAAARTES
jgi:drug/metabolite transporter (DMT)-like permease